MSRGPELTEFQRGGIIYCWKAGVKQKVIAQVVRCSEAVVCNIINRYKSTSKASVKTNKHDLRVIKRTIKWTLSAEQFRLKTV